MLQEAGLSAPPPLPQPPPAPKKPFWEFWSSRFWKRAPTQVGLVLTVISLVALVELFPRLAASPSSPTNIYTPVFSVSNDGYLKVTDVTSGCFLWRLWQPSGVIESTMSRTVHPPENQLTPTEAFPVPCDLKGVDINGEGFTRIDLAIVVYYRPWPFTMFRTHKLIRFSARPGLDKRAAVWDRHPVGELEADFDKWLTTFGGFP